MSCNAEYKRFTLVELLVVTAIIAILAALLFPSLGRFRKQVKLTVCASNLRNVTAGMIAYATDNDGLAAPADMTNYFGSFQTRYGSIDSYFHKFIPTKGQVNYNSFQNKILACPGANTPRAYITESHDRTNPNNVVGTDYIILFGTSMKPDPDMINNWAGDYYIKMVLVGRNGGKGADPMRSINNCGSGIEAYLHNDPAQGKKIISYRTPRNQPFIADKMACSGFLARDYGVANNPNATKMHHAFLGGNTGFADGHVQFTPFASFWSAYRAAQWWGDFGGANGDCGGVGWYN